MTPDLELARQLCALSTLSYDVIPKDPENPSGFHCVGAFTFIVREYPDRIEIAFQGTHNRKELLADLEASFEVPSEVEGWPPVHVGFWRATWACMPVLEPLIPSGKPIYLGGHSLAGEMAKKAAGYLAKRGHNIAGVYTWGCPNGGGVQYANWYNALGIQTWDFIRGRDPIPFLPPYGVPTGQQVFLDARGRIIPERMKLPWWNVWGWLTEISWHSQDGYLGDMETLAAW